MGKPLDGPAWFWELSCPGSHLSALGTGRTGVLPGRVFLTVFHHRELPPRLHPTDGTGHGSVYSGFEKGSEKSIFGVNSLVQEA